MIDPAEIKKLALSPTSAPTPGIRSSGRCTAHPAARSATTRSGYARAPTSGVDLYQKTEVFDILVEGGSGGGQGPGHREGRSHEPRRHARRSSNCTAGWASQPSNMAGVTLPITTHPLQAAVTEPVKTFLPTVVAGSLHVYVSQTDREELVFGASAHPVATYNMGGTLEFTEELAGHVLELMPGISKMRLLRQWAGLCDMTPTTLSRAGPRSTGSMSMSAGGHTASRPGLCRENRWRPVSRTGPRQT